MNKVHTVYRIVKSQLGGAITHPLRVCSDKDVAEGALTQQASAFAEILEGTVLVKTPKGPRAIMTVQQLLMELGICGLSYAILPQDVHVSNILTPTAAIIQ